MNPRTPAVVGQALAKAIEKHGNYVLSDAPQRRALLSSVVEGREYRALDLAYVGVVIDSMENEPSETQIITFAKRLRAAHPLPPDLAIWAVRTWALALFPEDDEPLPPMVMPRPMSLLVVGATVPLRSEPIGPAPPLRLLPAHDVVDIPTTSGVPPSELGICVLGGGLLGVAVGAVLGIACGVAHGGFVSAVLMGSAGGSVLGAALGGVTARVG